MSVRGLRDRQDALWPIISIKMKSFLLLTLFLSRKTTIKSIKCTCISTTTDGYDEINTLHVKVITNRLLITLCHALQAGHMAVRQKVTSLGDAVTCDCALLTKQQI